MRMFLLKTEIYLKEIFSFFIRLFLVPAIIRKIICKKRGTIICYHNVSSKIFRRHLTYLAKHYNIISLDRLVSAIVENKWKTLPERALAITMDDGFSGNYGLIPVLDEFKIPITIFTRPDGIDEDNAININREGRKYLNKREISGLLKHNASFGAHSMTHSHLSKVSDSQARYEIKESKNYLEKELFIKIKHFAYPYGDYSKKEIEILKDRSGYMSARTVKPGWIDEKINPYELKCMGMGDNVGINKMILDVTGIFPFLRILREKFSIHFDAYKTPFTYITGILNLRTPIAQHTWRQAQLIRKYAMGKKRLLEIGIGEGGSATVALEVMDPKGKMWLIDPFHSTFYPFFSLNLKMAKRALAKFKTRDITLIRDYSYNVAGTWNTRVDYLLLDADHTEEGFMKHWNTWNPFIDNNGVILIQSVRGPFGDETGTARAIRQLLRDADFKWEMIDGVDATIVMKRKK